VVLLLNSSSKGFHFVTKLVVLDLFYALINLINFGDFVVAKILIDCDYCKISIHPPLVVVWCNFT
jgi:hypothetical protein